MIRPRRILRWTAAALAVAVLGATVTRVAQAQEAAARLLVERAQSALDSTDVERSIDLFKRALNILPENAPRDIRVRVFLSTGVAFWALGEQDSATAYFSQLLRADPFHQIDTVRFNPQVVRAVNDLRRRTMAGTLSVPRDTVIVSIDGSLASRLRVTSGALVVVSYAPVARGATSTVIDSFAVDDERLVRIPVRDQYGAFLQSGEYEVLLTRVDSLGSRQRLLARRLRLTLTQEDTTALEPAPSDSVFRPERRSGGPGLAALFRGVLLGGIAAALPFAARNAALAELERGDSRAIAVGVTLAVAGSGAFIALAPGRPIAANVRFNELLREQWRERNDLTRRENARRRAAARTRIEDLGEVGRP